MMSQASDNVSGADNQQERPETIGWAVGFVDGEGCFSIAIQRCRMVKLGWQVFPEFVVTPGSKSLAAPEALQQFFGCGRIHINRRYDNHKENLCRYCVRAVADLRNRIVPFFRGYPLKTAKQQDFLLFAHVLDLMRDQKHLSWSGLLEIAAVVEKINRQKYPIFLESSETTRQTPPV